MRSDRAEDWVAELCNALGDLQDLSDVKVRYMWLIGNISSKNLAEFLYESPETYLSRIALRSAFLAPCCSLNASTSSRTQTWRFTCHFSKLSWVLALHRFGGCNAHSHMSCTGAPGLAHHALPRYQSTQ